MNEELLSSLKWIQSELGTDFKCSIQDKYIKIETPFLYPDNDVISVYSYYNGLGLKLSDLGETIYYLSSLSVEEFDSYKFDEILKRFRPLMRYKDILICFLDSAHLIDDVVNFVYDTLAIIEIYNRT